MGRVKIRLPDEQHERLRQVAAQRGISLNRLIEEFSTVALAELDAETRFRARAALGRSEKGLRLLDELDSIR
jgi:hypothetical protein